MSDSLSHKLRLARLALLWERVWPQAAAVLGLLGLFLALALFDVLPLLPGWLHALVLAVLGASALVLSWRAWRQPRPGRAEAARRLERDGGAAHHPLAALDDTLAGGDEVLWQAHRERMAKQAQSLRPGWPDPVLPARDPLGLRFAVLLLLVIAAAGGYGDPSGRLSRAVSPVLGWPGLGLAALEVWVVPPAYTGLAQKLLKPGPVEIPAGSMVRAVMNGGWGGGTLVAGDRAIPFQRDDTGSQRAEAVMESGSALSIRQGWREVAAWPVTVVPDRPPAIAAAKPPAADERGRTTLELTAEDDYGLVKAWVEVLPETPEAGDQPLRLDLPLPGERPRQARLTLRADLADHDWAGTRVRLTAMAEDGAGQIGLAPPETLVLPERSFRHPVAQALIQWRRQLSDAPRLGPEVAGELRELLDQPQAFGGDLRVFLTLALTRHLLTAAAFERAEMRSLLWYAATRIEDGGRPAAEQALEEARSRLEQALAGKAAPEHLARLVEELEAAMAHWLDALAEQGLDPTAQEGGAQAEADLSEMLDTLHGLAETGDRDGLRRRLEQLSRLLGELGQARTGGSGDGAAARTLRQLRDLAHRQQELLDQSFRKAPPADMEDDRAPAPRHGKGASAEARQAAEAQKALRRALDQLGKSLDEAPDSLAQAGRAMREAESGLGREGWAEAAQAQAQAIDRLRDGARQLVERMEAAHGKGKAGLMLRDPFGRALNGRTPADDGSTKVTGSSELRRAREILQELRRRAGEHNRSESELDYLKRLLRQF